MTATLRELFSDCLGHRETYMNLAQREVKRPFLITKLLHQILVERSWNWVSRQENIQHHFDHHNEQKNDLNLPEYYCTGCWHGGLGSGDYANKLSLILSISRKLSNFASLHEQIYIGKFRYIWNNSAHIHIAHRMIITVIFLIKQKITCSRPGSNRGPFACKANVMTSTLRERHAYTLNAEIFCYVSTSLYLGNFAKQQMEKRRHENFNASRSSSPWVTVTGLVV